MRHIFSKCFITIASVVLFAGVALGVGGTKNWGYSTADLYGEDCIQDYIDSLVSGSLTSGVTVVGNATISGSATIAGDIAAGGNILGDDATIISNIATIAVDTIMSDGASLTLGDGTETIAINSSLTDLSALGAFTGVLSVTLTNGASVVAVNGTTLRLTEATIDLVGNTTVDTITVADKLNITVNATSVTNNHILTIDDSFHILDGIGQANNYTNTLVLDNPRIIGDVVTLAVKGDSTNLVTLADSGNLNLAGAWLGDNFDTITLIAQEAAEWTEVTRSNN